VVFVSCFTAHIPGKSTQMAGLPRVGWLAYTPPV
jgi:hypothetical protein